MRNTWNDKNYDYAYSGINKIKESVNVSKSINEIKNELASIRTYTRHKEARKVTNFNPFFVYKKHEMWQCDIMYLPNLSKFNKGYKYLLCLIDVFSRKLYVKILKVKTSLVVLNAFDEMCKYIKTLPDKLVVDKGGEFNSKMFINYCKEKNIKLIFTQNETKAAHVERAQRSFQNILYKIMEEKQSKNYIEYMTDILFIYNNRKNRMTEFSPNLAFMNENADSVRNNLEKYYSSKILNKKKNNFKEGDYVRIKEKRNVFTKGYLPYFSEEVFRIKKVLTNLPQPRYVVTSFTGEEEIIGTFYEKEITKATHEEYKIEKILKTRKKKNGEKVYYVKWMGYDSTHNSWVNEEDITEAF